MGYIYHNTKREEDSENYSSESMLYNSMTDNQEIQIQSASRNVKLRKTKAKELIGQVDIDIELLMKPNEV